MRTISLRQFRDHIADLDEPVTVQRRDKAGNFQVLGEWRPLSGGVPAAVSSDGDLGRRLIVAFGAPHPVPKPARK